MPSRSPRTLFMLVFALSAPFWWLGSVSDLQLMPGLSVSALMTFCPVLAALLLVRQESGMAGVRGLVKRSVDFRRITDKRCYLPILLLMLAVSGVVYGLMRALDLPLPDATAPAQSITQGLADLPVVPALLMFAAALFHATLNLSFMLFQVNGSHFDMWLGGVVMAGGLRWSFCSGNPRLWLEAGSPDRVA